MLKVGLVIIVLGTVSYISYTFFFSQLGWFLVKQSQKNIDVVKNNSQLVEKLSENVNKIIENIRKNNANLQDYILYCNLMVSFSYGKPQFINFIIF
jgi:uncharacterized BrkB/YihY/UPF0761 family membrane protein